MKDIVRLIEKDLSEPYSIFTYRYFIHTWPDLCITVKEEEEGEVIGVIVCKAEIYPKKKQKKASDVTTAPPPRMQGYIAMLAVDSTHRKKGVGTSLARKAIETMRDVYKCKEIVLEAEYSNKAALRFYDRLGFVREKRMRKYYMNGSDAFHLTLWLPRGEEEEEDEEDTRISDRGDQKETKESKSDGS